MDKQTSEIRAQKWAEIVIACNRSGQPKTAWCEEHGINRKSFYYWQSKLRKQAAGLAPATNSIVPLRITGSQKEETANQELPAFAERAIRIQMQGLEIVIPAESPPAYVAALAKELVSP